MSSAVLRSAWALSENKAAISEGVRLIRQLTNTDEFRTSGYTSAEFFRLASKLKPRQDVDWSGNNTVDTEVRYTKSGQRKSPPPPPPNPEHPIRSITFLKHQILPVLEGSKEIRMATGKRYTSNPEASAKGKGKTDATALATTPISHNVRLWMPAQKPRIVPKSSSPTLSGAAVGVGEDWGHLSRRRQRVRDEKVKINFERMVQKNKEVEQERKREVWERHVARQERLKQKMAERFQKRQALLASRQSV